MAFFFVFFSLRTSCYIFALEQTVKGETIKIGSVALEHFAQFFGPDSDLLNVQF